MIRSLLPLLFLLGPFVSANVQAQGYDLTAVVQPMESEYSAKLLFTTLIDLMPDAEVTFDDASGTLHIQTSVQPSYAELEQATLSAGYYLISLQQN